MAEPYRCLICGRSEDELPLVAQRHRGHQIWVCTACMPVVIHHPEQVRHRLETLPRSESANAEES